MKEKIINILKFFGVSGIGWIIDMCFYALLSIIIKPIFANLISSTISVSFVYFLSVKNIFKNSNSKKELKLKYMIYIIYQIIMICIFSYIIGYIVKIYNECDYKIVIKYAKILAKITTTPLTMTLNYLFMCFLIEKFNIKKDRRN